MNYSWRHLETRPEVVDFRKMHNLNVCFKQLKILLFTKN